jgi:hypothetical protein
MSFYSEMAATALELLTEFGMSVTLNRVTPGAYNPATGTSAPSSAAHAGIGAKFDYDQDEIDGTKIRTGDQRVYIAPSRAVTPRTADTLTIGSELWQVVASRPLAPAGVVVLHDVQVRR